MSETMHAVSVEQCGQPFFLRNWKIPEPGPGQILVKTEACGVRHPKLADLLICAGITTRNDIQGTKGRATSRIGACVQGNAIGGMGFCRL